MDREPATSAASALPQVHVSERDAAVEGVESGAVAPVGAPDVFPVESGDADATRLSSHAGALHDDRSAGESLIGVVIDTPEGASDLNRELRQTRGSNGASAARMPSSVRGGIVSSVGEADSGDSSSALGDKARETAPLPALDLHLQRPPPPPSAPPSAPPSTLTYDSGSDDPPSAGGLSLPQPPSAPPTEDDYFRAATALSPGSADYFEPRLEKMSDAMLPAIGSAPPNLLPVEHLESDPEPPQHAPQEPVAPSGFFARHRRAVVVGVAVAAAMVLGLIVALSITLSRRPTDNASTHVCRIVIQSIDTKQSWMAGVQDAFNSARFTLPSGKVVEATVYSSSYNGVDGSWLMTSLAPAAWSPESSTWVPLEESKINATLIADKAASCRSTTLFPLGFAMWRDMAVALGWPDRPITFAQLAALALNRTAGWASIGPQYAKWGRFRLGHGDPQASDSGRLFFALGVYSFANFSNLSHINHLTEEYINSASVAAGILALESAVDHLEQVDTVLLDRMVSHGPGYLHAAAAFEPHVVRYNALYPNLTQPLVFIIPTDGTFWMDNPICVIDLAPWTSPTVETTQAARLFLDFALSTPQLSMLPNHGMRPFDPSINISGPGSFITRAYGASPNIGISDVPNVPLDSIGAINSIVEVFYATKTPTYVVLVLGISASMNAGGDSATTTPFSATISAVESLILGLQYSGRLSVITFGDSPSLLQPRGELARDAVPALRPKIANLFASGSVPALYRSVTLGLQLLRAQRERDTNASVTSNYIMVLQTDSPDADTRGNYSEILALLPDYDVFGPRIFAIAFGQNAGVASVLSDLASRSSGLYWAVSTSGIAQVYTEISYEM